MFTFRVTTILLYQTCLRRQRKSVDTMLRRKSFHLQHLLGKFINTIFGSRMQKVIFLLWRGMMEVASER